MTSYTLNDYQRPVLQAPEEAKQILLHSCCAPCAGEIMLALASSKIETTLFFYNPNIHPKSEYEIRKNENKRFADKLHFDFIDADYDVDRWFDHVKGLEFEPERGKRCTACFDLRFEKTAEYAKQNGFKVISSTLGLSRWKDLNQINQSGVQSATKYDVEYWTWNWRKKGGSQRMIELSKIQQFYKQEYCGCIYSLRDTNQWRQQNNRPKIKRGKEFYQHSSNMTASGN